jgi:hypothetical protein
LAAFRLGLGPIWRVLSDGTRPAIGRQNNEHWRLAKGAAPVRQEHNLVAAGGRPIGLTWGLNIVADCGERRSAPSERTLARWSLHGCSAEAARFVSSGQEMLDRRAVEGWRRRRDLNPRYLCRVCSLSKGVPSATRPRLRPARIARPAATNQAPSLLRIRGATGARPARFLRERRCAH